MARVYGGWPYNLVQLGREVTPGTGVAATTIMRGIFGGYDDQRQSETIEENIGILFPAERTRITNEGVTVPMPATALTYQQLPHILEAGIGTVTPTGADPYVYSYAFPTGASVNTIKTYTMEIGNKQVSDDLRQIPYCWVEEFELSGEAGGLWQMSATWQGQQDSALGGGFAAATLPSVTEAVFGNTLFYVDDSGGTIGTTQYSGILMGATINVRTGIVWVPAGDGNLYPIAHKFTRPEATFTLTFELEDGDAGTSFVAQERSKFKSESLRLIRLNVPGPGDLDLTIDFAAKYDRPGPYNNSDGNTTVEFEGHAVYSSADSLAFEIEVTNNDSAIP